MRSSDWFAISHIQDGSQLVNGRELSDPVIKRRRWSKSVSQLNFLTDHWKKLDCFPYIGTLMCKAFRSQSSQNLEDQLWNFIWREIQRKIEWREKNKKQWVKDAWLSAAEFRDLLKLNMNPTQRELIQKLNSGLDYKQTLLVWHIATELCFQNSDHCRLDNTSECRSMCKLLSDYMFYLAEKQPAVMTDVHVLQDWEDEYKTASKQIRSLVPWKFFSNKKSAARMILFECKEGIEKVGAEREKGGTKLLLPEAVKLARALQQEDCRYPWEGMCKVWVQWMCFAALRCRPNIHADRLSKGGELLTIVWLLMNHFGFGTKYRALTERFKGPGVEILDDSAQHEYCPFEPLQPHGS